MYGIFGICVYGICVYVIFIVGDLPDGFKNNYLISSGFKKSASLCEQDIDLNEIQFNILILKEDKN